MSADPVRTEPVQMPAARTVGRSAMTTRPERTLLTYEDYCRLPDDLNRYELFEGVLVVAPSPNRAHQTAVSSLHLILGRHVRDQRLGMVWVAPYDVLLNDNTIVQPDLLFVAQDRLHIAELRYVRGAPDLVIEVLSPGTPQREREAKRDLYARYGVPHYWEFDPDRRTAEAYLLLGGSYSLVRSAQGSESFSASPFPDLMIPLHEIWEPG